MHQVGVASLADAGQMVRQGDPNINQLCSPTHLFEWHTFLGTYPQAVSYVPAHNTDTAVLDDPSMPQGIAKSRLLTIQGRRRRRIESEDLEAHCIGLAKLASG